jgi:hypothetical protein
MQIIDCEQGSPEWFTARMGIPTASEFKTILAVKKEAREKITRQAYMRKLAGEVLTGLPMESYSNGDMQRGKDMEDEARDLYALLTDVDPMRVGFIINHGAGCSPDSLIGETGGLEIKSALPHIQIERLEAGELPPNIAPRCRAISGSPSANGGTSQATARACRCSSNGSTVTTAISPRSQAQSTNSTRN